MAKPTIRVVSRFMPLSVARICRRASGLGLFSKSRSISSSAWSLCCQMSSICAMSRCQPLVELSVPISSAVDNRFRARYGRELRAFGFDPPDAAAVFAQAVIRPIVFLPLGRQPVGVLDHEAVHVGDVERAVRASRGVNGTEPLVAAGEKLASRFIRRSARQVGAAGRREHIVLN